VNAIFNSFLSRKIPREDVFILALADGKVYKNTSEDLSKIFVPDPEALKRWGSLTKTETGELDTIEGPVHYYLAKPINANGKKMVFAIIKNATIESEEINQEIVMVLEVTLGVLAIAALLTLLMAGQILRPLHLLTHTARSISEPDLTQRIPVKGSDELAELTQTFNAMLDRLQATFTSQKAFMNEIGHELRTPITIMRVHLELLGDDPQERRETVALLTDELDRMSRLVNDLILLAKAEQPDFLSLEMVEVHTFTEELYAKAQALGNRHWQLESDGSGKVVCDRQRLTQAMMNLVLNAIQQTTEGAQIAIGSAVKGSDVHFWVRDTGPGIAPEAQPLIFDRFIRCPVARRRFEGMGLGLAIVHSIAEAHGGRVELLSQIDNGSIFTVVIPIDPPSG
jgi:signal transduction histidine kinase